MFKANLGHFLLYLIGAVKQIALFQQNTTSAPKAPLLCFSAFPAGSIPWVFIMGRWSFRRKSRRNIIVRSRRWRRQRQRMRGFGMVTAKCPRKTGTGGATSPGISTIMSTGVTGFATFFKSCKRECLVLD